MVQLGITVRLATVIDQARRVPADFAVEVVLIVQRKDVGVLFLTQFVRLFLAYSSSDVLDQPRTGGNVVAGKQSSSVDARPTDLDRPKCKTHLRNFGLRSLKVCSPVTYSPAQIRTLLPGEFRHRA